MTGDYEASTGQVIVERFGDLDPVAIPAVLVGWGMKLWWLPGRNWVQVLGGMALVATVYYATAYFTCLEKEHRAIAGRWMGEKLRRRAAPEGAR